MPSLSNHTHLIDQLKLKCSRNYENIFFELMEFMKFLEFTQKTANAHNQQLCQEIRDVIEEGAKAEIIQSGHLDEYNLNSLYLGMKEVAFEMVR